MLIGVSFEPLVTVLPRHWQIRSPTYSLDWMGLLDTGKMKMSKHKVHNLEKTLADHLESRGP